MFAAGAFRGPRTGAIVLLSALPAAQGACTQALGAACNACRGSLQPSTCLCTCAIGPAESSVAAMLLLPVLALMMLYI